MIIKASFLTVATVATVAALAISNRSIINKPSRKRRTYTKHPEIDDADPQEHQREGKTENNAVDDAFPGEKKQEVQTKMLEGRRKKDSEPSSHRDASHESDAARRTNSSTDIDKTEQTKHLMKLCRNRELAIQNKLLELNGFKERHSFVTHLRRQLTVRASKVELLKVMISSLEAEKCNLEAEIRQDFLVKKQLEKAGKMVEELEAKKNASADQIMGQLKMLEEQVASISDKEKCVCPIDRSPESNLKTIHDVNLEVLVMKRRNKELELQKRELGLELNATRAKIISLSKMTEDELIARIKEELSTLTKANEDLLKQLENLQSQRLSMVEELVYQRWLNSCLRFETQYAQSPHENSGLGSQQRAESTSPADFNSPDSPQSQTSAESSGVGSTSTTIGSSSTSSQSSVSKRPGLIKRLKKWGISKSSFFAFASPAERSSNRTSSRRSGLVRSFSTSMVPDDISTHRKTRMMTTRKDFDESPETPIPTSSSRQRRVSFNDVVSIRTLESAFQETVTLTAGNRSFQTRANVENYDEFLDIDTRGGGKADASSEGEPMNGNGPVLEAASLSDSSENLSEQTKVRKRTVIDRIKVARSEEEAHNAAASLDEEKVEDQTLYVVAVLFIFIFTLLIFVLIFSWLF